MIQAESTNKKQSRVKAIILAISLIVAVFVLLILVLKSVSKDLAKACISEIDSLVSSIDGSEDCVMIHLADGGKTSLCVLHSPDGESCYIKDDFGEREVGFLNKDNDILEIYRLDTETGRPVKDSEKAKESLFDTFQIAQSLTKYKGMQVKYGIIDKKDEMKMEAYLEGDVRINSFYYEDGARVHFSDNNSYTFVSIGDTAKAWLSTAAALYLGNVNDEAINARLVESFIDFGATREKAEIVEKSRKGHS